MRPLLAGVVALLAPFAALAAEPTRADAEAALKKAVRFFRTSVEKHGGYLWQYSGDLTLAEAEGRVADTRVWVQPPGTPTVGEAFLDAYEATGDPEYLDAAKRLGATLVKGQMRTGGWAYSVETDPEKRKAYRYRDLPDRGKFPRANKDTVLDDDTTTGALRFLARLDRATGFKDAAVHDAVEYAVKALLAARYPNGGWFGWWETDPTPPSADEYPVKRASYPETWARSPAELGDRRWAARYVLNDDLMSDMIRTWLLLWDVYKDDRYLAAARKCGDFLLLAQLPDPQPAWAQQYDAAMHPVWGRKFEPPAVASAESMTILENLMLLYRRTGDKKYLEPIPRASAYLRKSVLPDGKLARFYELRTNRPLYFTKEYMLTYSADDLPTHYGWFWPPRLDAIDAEYKKLAAGETAEPKPGPASLRRKAQAAIAALDDRGAWVEKGSLRFHKAPNDAGVIRSQTFADHVAALARFIAASK